MNRLSFLLLALSLFLFLPYSHAAERVHAQLDRSLYAAGETIWLRAWVWDDDAEAALPASRFLYVELLRDGQGSVERRIKLKARSGLFFGQMPIPEELESGWYTLRAYTRAQQDWPADALFHTRLLIRGSGAMPGFCEMRFAEEGSRDGSVRVSFSRDGGDRLTVTLSDEDGHPLVGNFALSVVSGRYAEFDYQSGRPVYPAVNLVEGPREYTQELDFRVKSVRNRMPDQYGVAIMAQEIGYYFSTEVAGDRTVRGADGQSFRIPDLDYPEETLFSVNVTGSQFLYPADEPQVFAEPFDYGPTYPVGEEIRDTIVIRQRLEGTVAPAASSDTLTAARITAEHKSSFYKPERLVGPFSNVFEWRQVKLREELKKYDDMDLMAYISAHFSGLVVTFGSDGLKTGRKMYTTRSGSITQRVVVSHGKATYNNKAGYRDVDLYIDGKKEPDWEEVASMTVRDVQNLYVLRGAEAALYRADAVVLLELRHFDEKMLEEKKRERKATIGLLPLGYQQPEAFPMVQPAGTLYWNPCIRTDTAGRADIALPALPENCYYRLEGRTLDGRFFSASR